MTTFRIDGVELAASLDPREGNKIRVLSVPRPYSVEWASGPLEAGIDALINDVSHPLVLIDQHVGETVLKGCRFANSVPTMSLPAKEDTKNVYSALDVCAFLQRHGATRGSMLFVIGGGVLQDVGAFAAAAYKRGIPWTYIPTTLLGQADSCIGGKTGLNHDGIKNLIALFSAPSRVLIHTAFLATLSDADTRSGLGEVFRLHVTGGELFLAGYDKLAPRALAGDLAAIELLIAESLSVKRAVIERDEFELDLRKAMNYGHSMGHAFEAISQHALPHGLAVVIGMLVENEIALEMAGFPEEQAARLSRSARLLVSSTLMEAITKLDISAMGDVLLKDKKSVGKVLKLACQSQIGTMRFVDYPLDVETPSRVTESIRRAHERLLAA